MPTTPICIPAPQLVPFADPPNYVAYNPNSNQAPFAHDGDLLDPRWTGSIRVEFGSGAGSLAYFRALHDPVRKSLYLLWHQKTSLDPTGSTNSSVYVGFNVGTYAHVFQILPFTTAALGLAAAANPSAPVIAPDFANPNAALNRPFSIGNDWQFDTASGTWKSIGVSASNWIEQNTAGWYTAATGKNVNPSWAVGIRVPLTGDQVNPSADAGVPAQLGQTVNMFYWMVDNSTIINSDLPFVFPTGAAYTPVDLISGPAFPKPGDDNWVTATIGGAPDCGQGVSVDGATLNIDHAKATDPNVAAKGLNTDLIIVNADPLPDPPNVLANQIVATVKNDGPATGQLNATYRLANWGTQGVGNFPSTDQSAKDQVWPIVSTALLASGVGSGATGTFPDALWGAGTTVKQMNQFIATNQTSHQCMMVEVDGADSPTPVVFKNDTAIQNMNFTTASLVENVAEVNVLGVGVDPFGTASRTIYLLVETDNLPPVFDPADARLRQLGSLLFANRGQPGDGGISSSSSSSSSTSEILDSAFSLLDQFCPLLKIHGLRETGQVRATPFTKVLTPMTSFGLYLDHVGTLLGWDFQIVGADRISSTLWRVRVPNSGKILIKIRVLAKENPTDSLDHSGDTPTVSFNNVSLFARNSLMLADRVQVQDSQGKFTAPISAGGSISVGTDAKLGNVVAGGSVQLRDRDQVTGSVTAHQSVTLGNGVSVSGGVTSHATVKLPNLSLQVTFPATNHGDVFLQPDAAPPTPLAPGAYGTVSIASRATLNLTAGVYYFNSLDLEPQSKMVLDNAKGQVTIYVRTTCILRGLFTRKGGGSPSLFLGVVGQTFVSVEAPFTGTLVVPNGTINLATVSGGFQGAFFAGNITVQPGTIIKMIPFNGVPAIDA